MEDGRSVVEDGVDRRSDVGRTPSGSAGGEPGLSPFEPVLRESFAFDSADGSSVIAGKLWLPADVDALNQPRGIVQLVHGMAEHIMRYDDFACYLVQAGYVVCGHDHIGHGDSAPEGGLGIMPPEGGVDVLVEDVDRVRRIVAASFPPDTSWFLFGHSMGSLVVRNYLAVHGEGLSGALVCGTASPALALSMAGTMLAHAVGNIRGPEFKSELLHALADGAFGRAIKDARTPYDWISHDPAVVDAFAADERAGFVFSAGAYATLTDAAFRAGLPATYAHTPKGLPVLVTAGSEDPVGANGEAPGTTAAHFCEAGLRDVTLRVYEGMRHEILNEVGSEKVYRDLLGWIERKNAVS